jgi:hypothetical protein
LTIAEGAIRLTSTGIPSPTRMTSARICVTASNESQHAPFARLHGWRPDDCLRLAPAIEQHVIPALTADGMIG